ncbi:hypothetical protein ACFL6L_04530 [candidate division KSB1 bacterium]
MLKVVLAHSLDIDAVDEILNQCLEQLDERFPKAGRISLRRADKNVL